MVYEYIRPDDDWNEVNGIWHQADLFDEPMMPVTHVCRKLRHEAIPPFYSRFCAGMLWGHGNWIHDIDPFAIQCLKGLRLRFDINNECLDKGGHCYYGDIQVTFGNESVSVVVDEEARRPCCAVTAERRKKLAWPAQRFAKEVEKDRSKTKKLMLALQQVKAWEDLKETGPGLLSHLMHSLW